MDKVHQNKSSLRFLVELSLFLLLFHGLSLLNNSAFWDSRMIRDFQLTNNYHGLHVLFYSSGLPMVYWTHRLLWLLSGGGLFVYNICGFFSIGTVGYLIYLILKKYNFSECSARIAAIVTIVYPGCQLTTFSIMTPLYVLFLFFFIGWYLSIISQCASKYYVCIIFRLLSLLFFILSFSFNSLLCFYAVFILFEYFNFKGRLESLLPFKNIVRYISRNLDFILIPFIFFVITKYYFPTYGGYKNYNHLELGRLFLLKPYIQFTGNVTYPLVFIPLCLGCIYFTVSFVGNLIRNRVQLITFQSILKPLSDDCRHINLMLYGFSALFFAILPYIVVGKISPKVWDFTAGYITETRFALLVPTAIGIFMAGFVPMFILKTKFYSLQMIGIISFLAAALLFWSYHYITLEGVSAFQKSFVYKLKNDDNLENFSLYDIRSDFDFIPYETYSWSTLLNDAYGGHSRIGYARYPATSNSDLIKYASEAFGANNYSPKGKCVSLDLLTGKYGGRFLKIGFLNLYYRFIDTGDLSVFLNNLITLKYKSAVLKGDVKRR